MKKTNQVGTQFTTTTRRGFDRMGVNGESVGYLNRKLAFIAGALPGEKVSAVVTKTYRNFLRARAIKIIRPSQLRVKPVDPYANLVGGFELENMQYSAQLRFKRALVKQALNEYRPRGYQNYRVNRTMGMQHPYHYRNKLQFPVRLVHGKVAAGLFKPRSHQLVDLKACSVQDPETMHVVRTLVAIIQELGIPVYNEAQHSGIIKTLVVRATHNTPDVQVTFVTNTPKFIKEHRVLLMIMKKLPEVTSVMQNVNPGQTSQIWGKQTRRLMGKSHLTEKLSGLKFRLSARSFLQLNSRMIPQLYEIVTRSLKLNASDQLVDAYSGVGTMGLPLAHQVKELRGMDIIPEAIRDANENAKLNRIHNARYYVGTAEKLLPQWIQAGWRPTALIVDPPRTGLAPTLIKAILKAAPAKFVYVSCNPATMARDLAQLAPKYKVRAIQPIDMMPQTARCECVVSFKRRN